jgi:hypothetical protein
MFLPNEFIQGARAHSVGQGGFLFYLSGTAVCE